MTDTLADAEDLKKRAVLVHFRVETPEHGPPIAFDYRLRPGIATSTNMEIMGLALPEEDVARRYRTNLQHLHHHGDHDSCAEHRPRVSDKGLTTRSHAPHTYEVATRARSVRLGGRSRSHSGRCALRAWGELVALSLRP